MTAASVRAPRKKPARTIAPIIAARLNGRFSLHMQADGSLAAVSGDYSVNLGQYSRAAIERTSALATGLPLASLAGRSIVAKPAAATASAAAPAAADHLGKLFIFEARVNKGDHFVFVKLTILPATSDKERMDEELRLYEANLIDFLDPDVNSRDEDMYHPMM